MTCSSPPLSNPDTLLFDSSHIAIPVNAGRCFRGMYLPTGMRDTDEVCGFEIRTGGHRRVIGANVNGPTSRSTEA